MAARWLRELTVGELRDLFETVPQPEGADAPEGRIWLDLAKPKGAARPLREPPAVPKEQDVAFELRKTPPQQKKRDRTSPARRDPVLRPPGTCLVLQPPAPGASLDLDARPYASPVHWAAFSLKGI